MTNKKLYGDLAMMIRGKIIQNRYRIHIQIPPTDYVGPMLRSTAVAYKALRNRPVGF